MSRLLTEENFSFAISVLLPGFMILVVFMMVFRTRMPSIFFTVVLSVVLSFFYTNILLTLQKVYPFLAQSAPKPIADLVNLVLVPVLIGYIGGTIWEILAPLLRRGGIPIRSPIPTAWDYAFGKRTGCWILIRFKDKERDTVKAFYNRHGFSGSDLDHPDLYVTEVQEWKIRTNENGTMEVGWETIDPPLSMWISGSEIHSIEFDEGILQEESVGQEEADIKRGL